MMAKKPERRKPGRPRKYGAGRINATVRFTPERYDQLKEAAAHNGRSVSEEVEARVERTFREEELADIRRKLEEVVEGIRELRPHPPQVRVEPIGKGEKKQ